MTKPVVLIVEDEPIIRMSAAIMLEDAGFDVIEASDADQAIDVLQSRRDIRIVFSDIEMPGSMNGLKLIHAIRECWPPIVLILTSGRFAPLTHEMPANTTFLRKPYLEAALISAVRGSNAV